MIEYEIKKEEVKTPKTITCDCCKVTYYYDKPEDMFEVQEFHYINFIAGYGSIFGDDCRISLDMCQHCLQEKLGKFIRINQRDFGYSEEL